MRRAVASSSSATSVSVDGVGELLHERVHRGERLVIDEHPDRAVEELEVLITNAGVPNRGGELAATFVPPVQGAGAQARPARDRAYTESVDAVGLDRVHCRVEDQFVVELRRLRSAPGREPRRCPGSA